MSVRAPVGDINIANTKEKLLDAINDKNIVIESEVALEDLGFGNLVDQLYKKVARPHLVNPVFLVEHPTDLSPLARANDDNPNIVDRFQLVINGAEIINAYSELVDPQEQEKRLLEQNANYKDWCCTEEKMKKTKDGKALYLHCLPADINDVSCKDGEVEASVFDRYRVPLYKQASYKPYVIAAMIFLSKFRDPQAVLSKLASDKKQRIFG